MSVVTEDRFIAGLNPAQREAVLHVEGPLLVLAGAGSGKTRVLTARIARLIETHGIRPEEILAVTFTNKAAGEMRQRVATILGDEPKGMWIGTFHAIGARMLRVGAPLVGLNRTYTIYDQDDTLGVVKRVMERHDLSRDKFTPRAIHGAISEAKNGLITPAQYAVNAADPFTRAVSTVYGDLDQALRLANAVDFDDLLVLPVRLLRENPTELARYQSRFRFVLVDEYQDTNRAQYQFIRLLGGTHGNVCVVGDDDQSIYGWRGADIKNILDFNKDFPDPTVVRLEENYRSTPPILELANVVISRNATRMGKTLRAHPERWSAGGFSPSARSTRGMSRSGSLPKPWRCGRVTIASCGTSRFCSAPMRTAKSCARRDALRRHVVPYRLIGSVRYYDRREIRDLMSYLKLIANPADDEAFRRAVAVPRRGLGETTIELLSARARAHRLPMFEAATRGELLEGFGRPRVRRSPPLST